MVVKTGQRLHCFCWATRRRGFPSEEATTRARKAPQLRQSPACPSLPKVHEEARRYLEQEQLQGAYQRGFQWATTKEGLRANAARLRLVAGAEDDLMNAPAYLREVAPLGVPVTLVPGVDHMGACSDPAALQAVVAAVKGA